jgi:hypothetical protein
MTLQAALTILLVVVSALYATWRLMPARQRLNLLARLPAPGHAGWLSRIHRAAFADAARGCNSCSAHPAKHPGAAKH